MSCGKCPGCSHVLIRLIQKPLCDQLRTARLSHSYRSSRHHLNFMWRIRTERSAIHFLLNVARTLSSATTSPRLLRPKEEPIDTHERQPTATHEPATPNIESRHSRAERSVATLPDSYVTGSGLGLSSSQEQSPFSDCADTSYAPQDSADIVLPEIITQLTAAFK